MAKVDLACALGTGTRRALGIETAREAAEGFGATLGPRHPYTFAALSVLGGLLADAGELDQAEEIEVNVAMDVTDVLRADHPDTLRCRANLLLTRRQRGNPAASAELEQVIDNLAEVLGTGHPHIEQLREGHRLFYTLDAQPF